MTTFKIGAFAAAAGVRRDTIRYYERTGLLRDPGRTGAGYRVYEDADLLRLHFIRAAQELGFTLPSKGRRKKKDYAAVRARSPYAYRPAWRCMS